MPQSTPRNWLIRIEHPVISRDAYGSELSTWTKLDDVWASFKGIGGKERFEASSHRTVAVREGRFQILWRSDVTEIMRVIYDGMAWNILGRSEVGYRKGLTLHCAADPDAELALPTDSAEAKAPAPPENEKAELPKRAVE